MAYGPSGSSELFHPRRRRTRRSFEYDTLYGAQRSELREFRDPMSVRSIFFVHCPEEMSQTRMDRSREAETMFKLSGEKQTQVIQSVCPRSRVGGPSRFESLILMMLSSPTDAANWAFEAIGNGSLAS